MTGFPGLDCEADRAHLRNIIDNRFRLPAELGLVVSFTPDAALALAELIEKLAAAAGIDLPEKAS
jgi:hypothetical protein